MRVLLLPGLYLEYLKDSSFDVNGTVPTFDDFLPLFSHNMRKNWSRDDPEAWIQHLGAKCDHIRRAHEVYDLSLTGHVREDPESDRCSDG